MCEVSLLTAKSETGFQNLVLVKGDWKRHENRANCAFGFLTLLVRRIRMIVYFLEIALNDKTFSHDVLVKTFVEKFLSKKPVEFYSRGINK